MTQDIRTDLLAIVDAEIKRLQRKLDLAQKRANKLAGQLEELIARRNSIQQSR